jgi:acyl-CoA thioesterase I
MRFSKAFNVNPIRCATRLLAWAALILAGSCADPARPINPVSADAVILAFGDSLTYGSGAELHESYPAVLQDLIGRRVINGGVPGEISAEGMSRLPALIEREQPALIILCHGGNDLLRRLPESGIESNLKQMIGIARSHGVQVVLIAVPRPTLIRLRAAPFYGQLAETLDVPIEPTALPRLESQPAFKSDQIHLNAEGYRMLAEAVAQLLRETGALPGRS